jgi:hypothetical protein
VSLRIHPLSYLQFPFATFQLPLQTAPRFSTFLDPSLWVLLYGIVLPFVSPTTCNLQLELIYRLLEYKSGQQYVMQAGSHISVLPVLQQRRRESGETLSNHRFDIEWKKVVITGTTTYHGHGDRNDLYILGRNPIKKFAKTVLTLNGPLERGASSLKMTSTPDGKND